MIINQNWIVVSTDHSEFYGVFENMTYNQVYSWALYKFNGNKFSIYCLSDIQSIKL